MIKFDNVRKSFDHRSVLNAVSFHIVSHEVVAVLGASGSGKTTLLRLICGLTKPDSGSIQISPGKIGYIFQDHRLLPWRTASQNIELVLRSAGMQPDEAHAKAGLWLDRMGLKGYHAYYPAQLSGGMVQRVSIARAFAVEPQIMLMDEPLSSLDTGLAESLLRDLKQVLNETRTTTVYVTHECLEAINIADRIFEIDSGDITITRVDDRQAMIRQYLTSRLSDGGWKGSCLHRSA